MRDGKVSVRGTEIREAFTLPGNDDDGWRLSHARTGDRCGIYGGVQSGRVSSLPTCPVIGASDGIVVGIRRWKGCCDVAPKPWM